MHPVAAVGAAGKVSPAGLGARHRARAEAREVAVAVGPEGHARFAALCGLFDPVAADRRDAPEGGELALEVADQLSVVEGHAVGIREVEAGHPGEVVELARFARIDHPVAAQVGARRAALAAFAAGAGGAVVGGARRRPVHGAGRRFGRGRAAGSLGLREAAAILANGLRATTQDEQRQADQGADVVLTDSHIRAAAPRGWCSRGPLGIAESPRACAAVAAAREAGPCPVGCPGPPR